MLLDIREKVRSSKPIKYTLITLICIPFALVGIGSYFSGGEAEPVATIDGVEISPFELDQAANDQRMRIRNQYNGQIPPQLNNEALIRSQALNQLVTAQVMSNAVEEERFAVGDAQLARAIRGNPDWQTDGKFDKEIYQSDLASQGLSAEGAEMRMREQTALGQFRFGVIGTSFVLPQEMAQIEALANQTRTVDILRFNMETAQEGIEVSDEDAQAYFDENGENYKFPERVKLQYITLDNEELSAAIDISDEEAQTHYDENLARYRTLPKFEASHILLSVDDPDDADAVAAKTEELNKIKQRIADGEDFAAIAKEVSEDAGSAVNGGSLGVITPGAMVPEFEQAVFALTSDGEISEPVASSFGVHLIKLDKFTPETTRSFDDAKTDVVSGLRRERASAEFSSLREIMIEQLFENPESLESTGAETGLEIQTSDWVDVTTEDPVLGHPLVLRAAFSEDVLANSNNSELLQISAEKAIAIRVLEHNEQRPKALEDVREEVVQTLKSQRAGEQLDGLLKTATEELAAGKTVEELATAQELATATTDEELTRQSDVIDYPVLQDIYALAKPADDAKRVLDSVTRNGDRVAVLLKSVTTPELSSGEDIANDPRLGVTEFSALLESLRAKASITMPEL